MYTKLIVKVEPDDLSVEALKEHYVYLNSWPRIYNVSAEAEIPALIRDLGYDRYDFVSSSFDEARVVVDSMSHKTTSRTKTLYNSI